MHILIGLTGKARAGKDTLAAALTHHGFVKAAFADPLKHVTAFIANEPIELFFEDQTKEEYCEALGMTRRLALQRMGTEGVRNALGNDVWVNRLLRQWKLNGCHDTVVSDVRFDNEADAIIAAGGFVLRVVRPDNAPLSGESATHVSEAGVSEDRVLGEVLNGGTIEDLAQEAKQFAIHARRTQEA